MFYRSKYKHCKQEQMRIRVRFECSGFKNKTHFFRIRSDKINFDDNKFEKYYFIHNLLSWSKLCHCTRNVHRGNRCACENSRTC